MVNLHKCSSCLIEKELNKDNFHADKSRSKGFMYTCKVCENLRSKAKHEKNPRLGRYKFMTDKQKANKNEWSKKYGKTPKGRAISLWAGYKKFDLKKGLENDISISDIEKVISKDCVYCGFKATGFDRLDNKKGHILSNCVPCCKDCNCARMDNFTHEEMKIIGKTIRKVKLMRINTHHIQIG